MGAILSFGSDCFATFWVPTVSIFPHQVSVLPSLPSRPLTFFPELGLVFNLKPSVGLISSSNNSSSNPQSRLHRLHTEFYTACSCYQKLHASSEPFSWPWPINLNSFPNDHFIVIINQIYHPKSRHLLSWAKPRQTYHWGRPKCPRCLSICSPLSLHWSSHVLFTLFHHDSMRVHFFRNN